MSQNKAFAETTLRKELSKLTKLQLIKRCKSEKISTNNSKKIMIDGLIKKYQKKHNKQSPTKNGIIKRKSTETVDRLKLLKLFQRSQNDESDNDKLDQFITKHPDKFVISVINIMLDKTADGDDDLETMLFHSLRGDPSMWLNLSISIKKKLKTKLLKGIITLNGTNKFDILAHIIAVITAFEEWNELIPALIDFSSAKKGKLRILGMISNFKPDRLKQYVFDIAKVIYPEILNVEYQTDSHETRTLFRILNTVSRYTNHKEYFSKIDSILDISMVKKIMKKTLVFLLGHYIINHGELKLFDSELNLNVDINKFNFNEVVFDFEESYDAANVYLRLFTYFSNHYFPILELHNEIFFVLNVFLKINGDKIDGRLMYYDIDGTEEDWTEDHWDFAIIAQFLFGIMCNFKERKSDYFGKMSDKYNFLANLISNINYDVIHKTVFMNWTCILAEILDINYFWKQKDLFTELLQREHPTSSINDIIVLKDKLCEPERSVVKYFIKNNNYSKLYDNIDHIPIIEIVLKYLSEYRSIDIKAIANDDKKEDIDYFQEILFKKMDHNNNNNILSEVIECVVDTLNDQQVPDRIIKEIYSYLPYSESTMNEEIVSNYILVPFLEQLIPCFIISSPYANPPSVSYNLSSIQFKLGWFVCHDNTKEKWPIGGKYYFCIQEIDCNNPLEPNNKTNKILFKSKLFEITTQDYEICKMYDINLKLNAETFYVGYMVPLDPSLNEQQMNKSYNENNTDFSIASNIDYYADQKSIYFKKAIGLPCAKKTDDEMSMTTVLYYAVKDKKYYNQQGYNTFYGPTNPLYDITFNCV